MTDNIKLEVIATYENGDQEILQTKVNESLLVSEKTLLDFIKSILNYKNDSDLFKLSLCWMCDENAVNKYTTIKESILKNAKYFFEGGVLIK